MHFDNGRQEFYNLKTDINELNNLLTRTLTNTERQNYNTLCNELSNLVGTNRCLPVSTQEISALGIKVFPTLFSTEIIIESQTAFNYQISDSQGRIKTKGKTAETKTILTNDWSAGIYFIELTSPLGSAIQKVVKY